MELAFSPEQQELVRTVRAFTKKELAPHTARWDASNVPSGLYFASLDALGARRTVKLAVVR